MKKFFIFCLMALAVCVNANAEKVVGHYHQCSTEYIVKASTDQNDLSVFIQVEGKYKNDKVFICIDDAENIQNFIDALIVCKTKHIEWSKVAKSNNITDFRKPINVKFPGVRIMWLSNKWYLSRKQNFNPEFVVGENTNYVVISGEANHWDNEYIDTKYYMFLTPNDIDELVKALNVDAINSILNKETETDTLFK